jgi:hypothetical protein
MRGGVTVRQFYLSAIALLLLHKSLAAQPLPAGKLRYLRPARDGWTSECSFSIAKRDNGWSIASVTERGQVRLTLETSYGPNDTLAASVLTLRNGDKESVAIAALKDGVARVKLPEQPPKKLDVPLGVIVTSAPDWTDTLLLCTRYDHAAAGKQTFSALWYHTEQPVQLLKLSIERQGYDTIQRDGKDVKLARFTIQLRGNSQYAAWATMDGSMVRLIPLPAKAKQRSGLILEGYEKSGATDLASP